MIKRTTPVFDELPYLDIDADVIEAFNRKSDEYPSSKGQPDYEQVSKFIREAADNAEARGDRVTLHPETARLIAQHLTKEGRKRTPGPQVDRAERLLWLGVVGHYRIEELRAERKPDERMDVFEAQVAVELATNVSDLKLALAGYRKFLKEIG